ncbi:hypothetical protein GUJ93_ZPchr0015g6847 [Zizania palustris]|uniref:Uncharacterized protein n=1 Tax=Zizania palustris TaxID=103762 RepID=A0A8J5SYD1_ZIZPA|nr:hypothetical protein GUJ93_ZPchr0015g6847 [Zizania palustris]
MSRVVGEEAEDRRRRRKGDLERTMMSLRVRRAVATANTSLGRRTELRRAGEQPTCIFFAFPSKSLKTPVSSTIAPKMKTDLELIGNEALVMANEQAYIF